MIAGRFKDYISTPKSNGYQSLHTGVTLRQPRNQKIEVQIRTAEMNDVAENGVAAHWVYKAPDKKVDGTEVQRFRWVQDLLEILENSAAPDEFLENTKLELYDDQVFCFTPKGQLIQLPRGATPVDFAYAVHSQVGDTCVGAKINGRLMPLRHHLENGDQVEIMTARGGTPVAAMGPLRRHRQGARPHPPLHPPGAAPAEPRRRPRRTDQGVPPGRRGRLGKGAGTGAEGAEDRHHRRPLHRRRQRQPRAPRTWSTPPIRNCGRPRAARAWCRRCCRAGKPPARHDHDMPVTGLVPGMAFSFAGCCHPVPGDEIVGIVTTGKGVTIHGRECQTLTAFAATPERFIDVDWNYEAVGKGGGAKGAGHTARISVIAANEPSALADISNAVAKQEGAIANLKIVNRQQDFMEVLVDVDVRDIAHLSKVIVGLRGLKAIKGVERATGGEQHPR